MEEITPRQRRLLRVIVDKYIETAEPVGSETIDRDFSLGVSPATIRNDMVVLEEAGLLQKPHASAGRMPTPKGLKYYINQLMNEKGLSIKDEVLLKERLWRERFRQDQLLRQATRALAERTGALAIATTDRGEIYHCGMARILNIQEFYDIDVTQAVLGMLDEAERVCKLFTRSTGPGPVHVVLGDELGVEYLEPVGIIYANYRLGEKRSGTIGVLGPVRLAFAEVIPLVRYLGEIIGEMAQGW